jgi:hypothetical protein
VSSQTNEEGRWRCEGFGGVGWQQGIYLSEHPTRLFNNGKRLCCHNWLADLQVPRQSCNFKRCLPNLFEFHAEVGADLYRGHPKFRFAQ